MTKRVSPETFKNSAEEYVARAYRAVTKIAMQALTEPTSKIQIGIEDNKGLLTRGKENIRDYVEHEDIHADVLHLDVPVAGVRLAIESHRFFPRQQHRVNTWLYNPKVDNVKQLNRSGDTEAASDAEIDWIDSDARLYKRNLVSPRFDFTDGSGVVNPKKPPTPRVYAYMYDGIGCKEVYGATIADPLKYKNAVAPACTQLDERLLDLSVETYLTHKVEGLLQAMEAVTVQLTMLHQPSQAPGTQGEFEF